MRRGAGFTLIELLVVVTIIGTVASMIAFALAGARQNALEQKTKVTIRRLHEALMSRWASYETRKISYASPQTSASTSPRDAATKRLRAIRELMRMELPQRMNEISANATSGIATPSANLAYRTKVKDAKAATGKTDAANASAECLYLILTTRMGEEESIRDSMKESEIGDTDKDGLFEFIDGWGKPIYYIRWPTGFISDLQPDIVRTNPSDADNHDPFDPMMTDDKAFRVFPLIFSGGRDLIPDIDHEAEGNNMNAPDYTSMRMGAPKDLDSQGEGQNGRLDDGDNIHNHMPL